MKNKWRSMKPIKLTETISHVKVKPTNTHKYTHIYIYIYIYIYEINE